MSERSYFIATSRLHQGLQSQRWSISELWSEYSRLRDMMAFPAGLNDNDYMITLITSLKLHKLIKTLYYSIINGF